MSSPNRFHPADVLGLGRLAVEATSGIVGVAEEMHRVIASNILPGTPAAALVAGTTAAIYEAVRACYRVGGRQRRRHALAG